MSQGNDKLVSDSKFYRDRDSIPQMTSRKGFGLQVEIRKTMDFPDPSIMPGNLSKYASEVGVYTLACRNVIPKLRSMSPAFKGHNADKKYLLSSKATIYPLKPCKTARGKMFEKEFNPPYRLLPPIPTAKIMPKISANASISSPKSLSNEQCKTVEILIPLHALNQPGWVFYIQNAKLETETPSFKKFFEKVQSLDIQPMAFYCIDQLKKL